MPTNAETQELAEWLLAIAATAQKPLTWDELPAGHRAVYLAVARTLLIAPPAVLVRHLTTRTHTEE